MARPSRRRGSVNHQFRKRVPADVLAKARGHRIGFLLPNDEGEEDLVMVTVGPEVTLSLRTPLASVAKERHAAVSAQFERWCDTLRTGPRPLTRKQRVALAGLLYKAFADGLEDNADDPELWAAIKHANDFAMSGPVLGIYETEEEGRSAALERRFGKMVDLLLQREGVVTDSASRNALLLEAGRALTQAAAKLQRNASGDYRPDPDADRFPEWEGLTSTNNVTNNLAPLTFDSLFERWQREVRPAASTVTTFRGQLNQFRKHLGHNEPRRVTRADVIAWKDTLVERGIKRINDGPLGTLNALFNFAVRDGLMESNPAAGIRVAQRVRAGERMLPYDDEEVARILALADQETHPARRWLPWLMALSGARVGELAQLWGERIIEIDGVPVMKIAPAKDGGSLKNEGSERDVPIHPALIKRGFLKFVKQRGDGPLFYRGGRRRGTGRHASKGVANHLADWIRSKGFTDKRKAPNHAFRHWFKTTCLNIGIQDSVADAIQGHVGRRGEADGYRHVTLAMKARAIKRIPVPIKKNGGRR